MHQCTRIDKNVGILTPGVYQNGVRKVSANSVLLVEKDQDLRNSLSHTLEHAGFQVTSAEDRQSALDLLRHQQVDLVLTEESDNLDSRNLLHSVKSICPDVPVVMMSSYSDVKKAVEAMRDGAADYLVRPFESDKLVSTVKKLASEYLSHKDEPIARDPVFINVLRMARKVAMSDATVLITGPSGTGKEVVARYIHHHSARSRGPFTAINCAAIPENMLEAILFGHEKGAFTGATEARAGKFELSAGGTLLLDEISEMNLGLQAKLLRVLQEKEVERLGGRRIIPLDARVVATSNRNLVEAVASGQFREDLYYRLNVFPIRMPALQERPGDIVSLARHFVRLHGSNEVYLTEEAEYHLTQHSWPGNVRELENLIQRALIMRESNRIEVNDLLFEEEPVSIHDAEADTLDVPELGSSMRNREYQYVLDTLKKHGGSRKETASELGISPRTLRYKLAKLRDAGIEVPA